MRQRPLARSYEELEGAEGREIFFRAQRFRPRDVFRRLVPDAVVNGTPLQLNDFSISGLSVLTPKKQSIGDIGDVVPMNLCVGDINLHEARARIRRIEPTPFRTKVAFELVKSHIDIADLLARHKNALLRRELEALSLDSLAAISPEYRLHCADALHFLLRVRSIVDGAHGADNGSADPRDGDLFELCEETVIPEWREIWRRGNELTQELADQAERLNAAKRYTELVLTPAFVAGHIWRHSYEKPRGYPGDFELMGQVYEWRMRGESLYDKLLHRIGLDVAECIATRMTMVKQAIGEVALEGPADTPAQVLSLGCGPAQEVANYLSLQKLPRSMRFTLVDQDHEALECAHDASFAALQRHGNGSAVNCLEISFSQLMRGDDAFDGLPDYDLIYSVGLVDYLTLGRARDLTASLFAKLKPGGRLIVGNMRDMPMSNFWPMEFICDWSVNYRSAADMHAMANGLPARQKELATDPTGRVYMLTLRK